MNQTLIMEQATKTLTEMLTQREYKIIEQDDEKIIGIDSHKVKIIVFLTAIKKFNVDRVKEFISALSTMEISHGIIVYKHSITPVAKKIVQNSIEIKLELFTLDELQHNITKHRLVPLHTRLSQEKADIFKKKFGIKFPVILTRDPISRFYNFARGDVIEITRLTGHVAYRIVKG